MSALQKNVASQKWTVFAFDRTDNTPKTGDAANITAKISKDWGAAADVDGGGNPTEIEDGYYVFDLSQENTNADLLLILPESTGDTQVIGVPATRSTVPEGFGDLNIEDGIVESNVQEVNDVAVIGSSTSSITSTGTGPTYSYTTQAEVERLWSVSGALYRTDDDSDGSAESGVWADIINEATDVLNMYLLKWYEDQYLYNNSLVRRWASVVGCYLLSQRRGNPTQFLDQYERVLGYLEDVAAGNKRIPRMPMRDDFTPSMRNYTVDHRFHSTKIRTVPKVESGGSYSGELKSPDPYHEPY